MRWRFAAAMTATALLAASAGSIPRSSAFPGGPPFEAGADYDQDFPDPHVVLVDGVYHAFGTSTGGVDLPMLTSTDLERWTTHAAWGPEVDDDAPTRNDALVRLPAWAAMPADGPEVWAPAVVRLTGGWRAYYAIEVSTWPIGRFCLSVATAPGPAGPFVDTSEAPLTCGYGRTGVIDPWVHVDGGGVPWLLWTMLEFDDVELADDDVHHPLPEDSKRSKTDPPRILEGVEVPAIWSQALAPDGLGWAEESQAAVLLTAERGGWEAGIVENPALFASQGGLHLFYSGNGWQSSAYATGWARCETVAGPCRRVGNDPVHASDPTQLGPGGGSVVRTSAGDLVFAYHAWNPPYTRYPLFPACDTDGDGVCADQGQRLLRTAVICELGGGGLSVGFPAGWPFCDTPGDSWMGPAVTWLSEVGVTTGVTPYRFAPERAISRAEAVTLLWRWAGRPDAGAPASFTDLRPGAFYETAVAWAARAGLVVGTSPTTFAPDDPITRGQLAAILHRAAGEPAPVGDAGFADVDPARFYATPVAWLAATGISTGVTSQRYAPDDDATRAAVATMLCRYSRTEPAAPRIEAGVTTCPS